MPISSALGSSALLPAGLGFRNKVINGAMVVAQRGTAAITGSGSAQYPVDRFVVWNNAGTVTFQQSFVAPTGFSNSILATVTATGSYGATGYTEFGHHIEGYNVADLAWGTSSAKPIVLSFWCRSSVTGLYNVGFQNGVQNRTYVATFTVNTAGIWEYKTIYVNGDTTGTWATDSTAGLRIWFNLGMGTNYDTTGGAWVAGNLGSTSSAVDFAANAGATFYLTGVQLEQNYQPTPFEQRPIGTELALCQRYYEKSYDLDVTPGTATEVGAHVHSGSGNGSGRHFVPIRFKVEKRSNGYVVTTHRTTPAGSTDWYTNNAGQTNLGRTPLVENKGTSGMVLNVEDGGYSWVVGNTRGHWTVNAEF